MLWWDKVAPFGYPVVPWKRSKHHFFVWSKHLVVFCFAEMTFPLTEVNWMFIGSSNESFLCRACSCCMNSLLPAWTTSSKWSIPGCRLSRTTTVRRSGSLQGKPQNMLVKMFVVNKLVSIQPKLVMMYFTVQFKVFFVTAHTVCVYRGTNVWESTS